MKTLIILILVLALAGALFFTRPKKADFETYIRANTQIVDGQAKGGTSTVDKIADQFKTFAAKEVNKSAADLFLEQCTYDNYYLWVNVNQNGKTIYTGALNHWFKRGPADAAKKTTSLDIVVR